MPGGSSAPRPAPQSIPDQDSTPLLLFTSLGMDPGSLDLAESRRILETEDAEEEAALTQEEEAEKDNIVKLASYNFSRSPSEQPQRSPNKKKLSRGMSFQPSVMEEDDDAAV